MKWEARSAKTYAVRNDFRDARPVARRTAGGGAGTVHQVDELVAGDRHKCLPVGWYRAFERHRLCDRASVGIQLEPDDATRAVIIDPDGDERVRAPPDPLEMSKGDRAGGGDPRRGSRPQVDSRHAVAMRHVGNSVVTAGGKTRWFLSINPHDAFEGCPAGTQLEQLPACRVEDEDSAGRRDGKIDERDRFEIGGNRERSQRAARDQLQLVQRSGAVARRRADHPEVSTSAVDFDRRDVTKPRGVGANEVHRVVRPFACHDQLAPEPIAKKESA